MIDTLLVLNTGSSSLKFQVFQRDTLDVLLAGKVTGIGGRVVVGHLGNGASLCALRNGRGALYGGRRPQFHQTFMCLRGSCAPARLHFLANSASSASGISGNTTLSVT